MSARSSAHRQDLVHPQNGTPVSPGERRRQERLLTIVLAVFGGGVTLGWIAFLAWIVLGPLWGIIFG